MRSLEEKAQSDTKPRPSPELGHLQRQERREREVDSKSVGEGVTGEERGQAGDQAVTEQGHGGDRRLEQKLPSDLVACASTEPRPTCEGAAPRCDRPLQHRANQRIVALSSFSLPPCSVLHLLPFTFVLETPTVNRKHPVILPPAYPSIHLSLCPSFHPGRRLPAKEQGAWEGALSPLSFHFFPLPSLLAFVFWL